MQQTDIGSILGDVLKFHGLAQGLARGLRQLLAGAEHWTGEDHHLPTVPVVEAVRTFARENVGCHE